MQVVSIISTKGGVGKTTAAANLGGFIADAGPGRTAHLVKLLHARETLNKWRFSRLRPHRR